jgi:hypothetical protein
LSESESGQVEEVRNHDLIELLERHKADAIDHKRQGKGQGLLPNRRIHCGHALARHQQVRQERCHGGLADQAEQDRSMVLEQQDSGHDTDQRRQLSADVDHRLWTIPIFELDLHQPPVLEAVDDWHEREPADAGCQVARSKGRGQLGCKRKQDGGQDQGANNRDLSSNRGRLRAVCLAGHEHEPV